MTSSSLNIACLVRTAIATHRCERADTPSRGRSPGRSRRHWLKCCLLLTVLTSSGCSTWQTKSTDKEFSPWSPSTWFKKEYQEPASLAAIWAPDTLVVAGQPTMRGFGGRIYFYNDRSQAVPVEGDLVVHGYLTTPGAVKTTGVDSDQRFVFSSEQLTTHFSPSQIGASYSIWIPWDEAEGFREEVTLIATFKSKQGSVVQGTPAKLFLPGQSRVEDELPAPKNQMVSYTTKSVPTHPGPENLNATPPTRTTTIEIPDNLARLRAQRTTFELGATQPGATATPTNPQSLTSAPYAPDITARLRSLAPPPQ